MRRLHPYRQLGRSFRIDMCARTRQVWLSQCHSPSMSSMTDRTCPQGPVSAVPRRLIIEHPPYLAEPPGLRRRTPKGADMPGRRGQGGADHGSARCRGSATRRARSGRLASTSPCAPRLGGQVRDGDRGGRGGGPSGQRIGGGGVAAVREGVLRARGGHRRSPTRSGGGAADHLRAGITFAPGCQHRYRWLDHPDIDAVRTSGRTCRICIGSVATITPGMAKDATWYRGILSLQANTLSLSISSLVSSSSGVTNAVQRGIIDTGTPQASAMNRSPARPGRRARTPAAAARARPPGEHPGTGRPHRRTSGHVLKLAVGHRVYALREFRLCLLDIPSCRHAPSNRTCDGALPDDMRLYLAKRVTCLPASAWGSRSR